MMSPFTSPNSYANFSTYGLRLNSVRYPNGRKVHFDYSSTAGSALNRLDAIKDDNGGSPGNTLAEYTYLGRSLMVVEDFVQPDVKLDYYGGTSGSYAGFDNFGRVVEQLWRDYGASADRDKFTYGYDRAGNRLYREHVLPSGKDERYTYDGVNQLTISQRGDLNQDKTAISGTPAREEDFTLDPLGNWSTYVQKTSGNTDLDQDRTHNKVNELTDISEEQGQPQWATPAHDRAGNMTTVPKPSSLANGLTLKYDAWNRLVQVTDGQTIVAKYEYDGEDRRIKKHIDSQSPSSPNGIDRYEHLFYVDTQLVETRNTTTQSAQPESLQLKYQFIRSPRYIDAPILRDENTDQDSLCDDGRIYYLSDANQNVTSLVDTAGDALERYIYDPYGRVTIYNAAWSSTRSSSNYSNYVLYTGRHLDPETGLDYYRARYYSAELGRFVGRDPIGYEGKDFNLYRYVHNRPTVRTDPTGLEGGVSFWDKCRCIGRCGPNVCAVGYNMSRQALAEAQRRYPNSLHNGEGDAWRHCYWSCIMAAFQGIGNVGAKCVGDFNEDMGNEHGQPPAERQMDEANNAVGVALGLTIPNEKSATGCADACTKALNDGKLKVLAPTH